MRLSCRVQGAADCCQHCCQATRLRPTSADRGGTSAQRTDRNGRPWTVCLLLRIRRARNCKAGLPPRTPRRMGCRPRCFNPSLPTRHAAGSSLHQRGETPHPESARSRRACFVPDEVVHRRSSRLLPDNHSMPEPGLTRVGEDTEETWSESPLPAVGGLRIIAGD
jgi:hypothetical protein